MELKICSYCIHGQFGLYCFVHHKPCTEVITNDCLLLEDVTEFLNKSKEQPGSTPGIPVGASRRI